MSELLGYDPIRLVTLRTRVVEAIDALGGIGSVHGANDDVAYRALATVAATQALLEHDYLRAIDQTLHSDSVDGVDLTVRLAAMTVPREELRGGWLRPGAAEQPFATMSDEELLGWIEETLGRQASDGGPPSGFDDERLFELSAGFAELTRRSSDDPDGFGRDLVDVMGGQSGRGGVLRMGDELNVSMRELGTGGTASGEAAVLGLVPAITWSALLNRAADDNEFDAWMLDNVDHASVARAVLLRPGAVDDPEQLGRVATTMTTKGSAAWGWYSEAPDDFRAVYGFVLENMQSDPESAATLFADSEARAAFLSKDWSSDDPVFEGLITSALSLPMLQRKGSSKSLAEANAQLAGGWAIWTTAVQRNNDKTLSIAAKRALASAMPVYLPSVSEQLLDENKNKESDGGNGTRNDRLVEAEIADERIPIATYGEFATLLGTMTLDRPAARRLASTSYDLVVHRMARGVATADDLAELRADIRPACAFNELISDGIDLKEEEMREPKVVGGITPVAATLLPVFERWVVRRSMWWHLATVPAKKLLENEPKQELITLSRTIPLDYASMQRIAMLEVMIGSDSVTRRRFGLGDVTAQRWQELDAALVEFSAAVDQEAIDEAEDRIEALTNDNTPTGEHDPSGAALARAVGQLS
ncbi:MAG: hypothetical protein M3501_07325 [Actinomycetota bacterium]|nr:hypothetical protein [Actinomycetota bacterium]MDQ3351758.1 hypothetical protein [Actinomycetota bacterium]